MRNVKYVLASLAFVITAFVGPQAVAADGDLQVIQQLTEAGSDLSKPHPIEFFLYFPSDSAAQQAADRLRALGFTVQVRPGASASDSSWLCLATREMLPEHEALVRLRADLNELASELGGEYDGWGTPVVQ